MKTYCQKCGSGTEYSLEKPKFCSNCAASFSDSSLSNILAKIPNQPIRSVPLKHEMDEEVEQIPDIDKLKVEVVGGQKPKVTLGNVLQQELKNPNKQHKRGRKSRNYETRQGLSKDEMKNLPKTFTKFSNEPSKNSINIGGED